MWFFSDRQCVILGVSLVLCLRSVRYFEGQPCVLPTINALFLGSVLCFAHDQCAIFRVSPVFGPRSVRYFLVRPCVLPAISAVSYSPTLCFPVNDQCVIPWVCLVVSDDERVQCVFWGQPCA